MEKLYTSIKAALAAFEVKVDATYYTLLAKAVSDAEKAVDVAQAILAAAHVKLAAAEAKVEKHFGAGPGVGE